MSTSQSRIKFLLIKESKVSDFQQAVEDALNDGYRFHTELLNLDGQLVVSMIKEIVQPEELEDDDVIEFCKENFQYALDKLSEKVKDLLEINGISIFIDDKTGELLVGNHRKVVSFNITALLEMLNHKPNYVNYEWLEEQFETIKRFK